MAEKTPYETLKAAIEAYGEAAMENFLRCRALGHAVAEGFDSYLEAPEPAVALVPPQGPFDPSQEYGDAAFSYDPKQPIRLEPIAFGISVTVPNVEDSGSLWIRTGIKVEVKDDRFEIFIANQPRLRLPLDFEGKLQPVYETLMAEFLHLFRHELADFGDARYQNRIGFVPTMPK
ncbi:hypothetical protein [Parvularcula lutaonensis]|uniref:DUF1997 domain-containing protein n=1 Tax=Parvularcula lutaonensis TaxID=491923 RepID=A0ABV7MBY7_9PROT|nr:hypothetical protein [Parvularcula lutaonensis]GGY49534.1 hypothetical protein GCM10007148_17690 [Parvularcula lutaonensis]